MPKRLLILGGYGNAGRLIAKYLLQETDATITLSGRNIDLAQKHAEILNRTHNTDRVTSLQVDASSKESLDAAFGDVDLVIVAASTTAYTKQVAMAAIEAGIDYFDIQISDSKKIEALKSLVPKVEDASLSFITDGGFHPGIPAAMVRYASSQFPLEVANIFVVMQLNWKDYSYSDATLQEFTGELFDVRPLVYSKGRWEEKSFTTYRTFDFGSPFHSKACVPMFMEELRQLPEEIPALQETGVYVAGFNWVCDYVVVPFAIAALALFGRAAQRPMARLLYWSLKHFSKPPYGSALVLEASGTKNDCPARIRMEISHEDAYELTAIPAVACLLQLLKGNARKPGLHFQAHVVEPSQFVTDIERLGLHVSVKTEKDI